MKPEVIALLRAFRALEENEDAIPVLGDDDAMKVLAAWRKTDQGWTAPRGKVPLMTPRNHAQVWAWLCSGWSIDIEAISRGSGLSPTTVHRKVEMLQVSRLIYPDGEMSKAARAALQVHIAQKLGIKAMRGGAKKNERDEGN